MAVGTLHSAVQERPIAARLAQRVSAHDQQPRYIMFLVEFLLAIRAEHLTDVIYN